MNVKYKLLVDFAWPNKSNVIMVSENDSNSRLCNFTLLFNKEAFDMSDVSSAQVQGVLPNGTIVSDAVDILTDDDGNKINVVEYLIPEEITKISGKATMVIELTGTAGETITSFEFYIASRNALYKEDEVTDEDKSNFAQLLNKINQQINKFEKLMENEALPNPYQISITVDGVTYNYTGANEVVIDMYDVGYINEFDPADAEDPIDETAAAQAIAAATLCEQGIKTNAQVLSEVNTKFSNLDSSIAEAKGYSDSTTEMYNKMKFFIDDTTVATDKVYSSNKVNNLLGSVASIDDEATATTSVWSSQKTQDAIDAKEISVDSALDDDSTNPVQNKIIKSAIDGKANKATTLEGYGITDAATKTSVEAVSTKLANYEDNGFVERNLWDEVWESGAINSTTGKDEVNANEIRGKNYIKVIPNSKIYIYVGSNTTLLKGRFYDASKNFISSSALNRGTTFTIPSNCEYFRIGFLADYGTTYKNDVCINYSDSRNGTYTSYCGESNRALTTSIANIDDFTDVTNEFTFSTDCTWNTTWTHLYKDGNHIRGVLRFSTPTTVSADKKIVTIPTKYKNKSSVALVLGTLSARWSGEAKGILAINNSTTEPALQLMASDWVGGVDVTIPICWRI